MDPELLEKFKLKREFKDGRIYEEVNGLLTVTPPIPPLEEIDGYELRHTPHLQKFRPDFLPADWKRMTPAAQEHFAERMWYKRFNGHWFYNNGEIFWIPGVYWFELCWWRIDVGLKEYRDRDRRKWLFWQTCVDDPYCFGTIYLKHRRDGATFMATCANYEMVTRHKEVQGGIQSKTGKDAKKVFQKLVRSFRKLPSFFQPIMDGTSNPQTTLGFFEPASRQTRNNLTIKRSEALDSFIDWQTTNSEAYDGQKLIFYHGDEWGKTVEADVYETWTIVKECLSTGAGSVINGKAMITSTCAEMTKKGGGNFKKVWDESDHTAPRNDNDMTTSGLYRLFLPAFDGLEGFIDEYGMSVIGPPTKKQLEYLRKKNPKRKYKEEVGAYQYLMNQREDLRRKGLQEKLMEYKRLYPFNEAEAFAMPPDACMFNLEKIQNRLDELATMKRKPYLRGNFVWVGETLDNPGGGRDGRVKFVENPNGLFKVNFLFKSDQESNKVERRGTKFIPLNTLDFRAGCDPVDHRKPKGHKGSNAAAYVFRLHNALEPDKTHKFVVQYLGRRDKPQQFYEDMIKMCRYYGCQILPENNKPGIITYFEERGYGEFIMHRPASTVKGKATAAQLRDHGAPANELTHLQMAEHYETYVEDHIEKIDFEELLEDLKEFNLDDTTKYDCAMAGGWTLISTTKVLKKARKPVRVSDYMRTYN